MKTALSIRTLLFALVLLAMSAASFAQFNVAITFGPPAIPVYEQPLCPGEGYIWTPGYWAYDYDYDDYYWVPGTWVEAPEVGFLWTPGYWGWGGDRFIFHEGYWGPQVGFYGGINYGYGYFGNGYEGGRWDRDRFYYNRTVNNINVTNIHNVYNTTIVNRNDNRVSYNGGNGGLEARPTPVQETAARERHIPPVAAQTQQVQVARTDREQRASVNRGKPPVAATPRPGELKGNGVVQAREAGAPYVPPTNRGGSSNRPNENVPRPGNESAARPENNVPRPGNNVPRPGNEPGARPENNAPRPGNSVPRPSNPVHPNDLPKRERPAPPNTGNPKVDQKYQQQQEKLSTKQDQERQKLQQKQDREHQKLTSQNPNEQRQQQVEQRHAQQTQNLAQRHDQQQQHLQQKQQPPPHNQPAPHNQPEPRH